MGYLMPLVKYGTYSFRKGDYVTLIYKIFILDFSYLIVVVCGWRDPPHVHIFFIIKLFLLLGKSSLLSGMTSVPVETQ